MWVAWAYDSLDTFYELGWKHRSLHNLFYSFIILYYLSLFDLRKAWHQRDIMMQSTSRQAYTWKESTCRLLLVFYIIERRKANQYKSVTEVYLCDVYDLFGGQISVLHNESGSLKINSGLTRPNELNKAADHTVWLTMQNSIGRFNFCDLFSAQN